MFILTAVLVILQLCSLFEAKPSGPVAKMPENCAGKSFCLEKSEDYPQKEIEAIIHDLNIKIVEEAEIGRRIGQQMRQVCDVIEKFSPIYEIYDDNGDVRYVAQVENQFIQKYTITECKHPGRVQHNNSLFTQDQVDQFNVTCVETRIKPKFLVLTHDKQYVEVVSARDGIPMGCSCRYGYLE